MQHTIAKKVSCEDIGIHSGKKVRLSLLPAPSGHGLEFVRTDLSGNGSVKVCPDVFSGEGNQTCLLNGQNVFLKTVEHLLSAIGGLGIDNLIIEVDNEEMPAMDGSAQGFVELIMKAGVVEQKGERLPGLGIKEPIVFQGEENAFLLALPSKKLTISLAVDFKAPVGVQVFSAEVDQQAFLKEIAPARTFGWRDGLEALWAQGKGLGAIPNINAIGLDEKQGYTCPLRFIDEIVRHKVLDLIGDLAGLRKDLKGHIIGYKTNHRLNINFMKKLACYAPIPR